MGMSTTPITTGTTPGGNGKRKYNTEDTCMNLKNQEVWGYWYASEGFHIESQEWFDSEVEAEQALCERLGDLAVEATDWGVEPFLIREIKPVEERVCSNK
jgi:hypothetical protein